MKKLLLIILSLSVLNVNAGLFSNAGQNAGENAANILANTFGEPISIIANAIDVFIHGNRDALRKGEVTSSTPSSSITVKFPSR